MTFAISALTARESFWDSMSVWLSAFVALGVVMESVTDFKVLAKWTGLESRHERKESIAKAGLLILIVALVMEVIAAIESHDISEQIISGLNTEIFQTQDREKALVELTTKLGVSNKSLNGKLSEQDSVLHSLEDRSVAFEKLAEKQKARDDTALALLKTEEGALEKAQNEASASARKAESAAEISDKVASDMEKTLHSENEMREKMRDLITPRSLSPDQTLEMSNKLIAYAGTSIDILQIGENPEIVNFHSMIEKSLLAANWKPIPSTAVGSGSFVGISIGVVEGASNGDIAAAQSLVAALKAEGVAINGTGLVKRADWPGFVMTPTGMVANKASIRLYIGSKQ
ncbi:hypothetical protein [Paraburkholderia graminis]|uniref:hypothetical protein n=1 Tax=Paraburkholderia graminis TaxID=60548 RepID=UPI0038BB962F